MAKTVQQSLPPMALSTPDGHRPSTASVSRTDQSTSIALTSVVKDVLIRHFGSLKAAAIDLQIDHGQLSRDLATGDFKFKRLEGFDDVKRKLAKAMDDTYGDDDPRARKRRVIRSLRDSLDELAELEERIA